MEKAISLPGRLLSHPALLKTVDMHKNLVIVRSGDQSLHEFWLEGPGERNWDLLVDYFGDDPDRYCRNDVERLASKGPKWPCLGRLITDFGERIADYDYVWFPDDDLMSDKASINRFFEMCREYHLELAQPALTLDSYVGHAITLRNKKFQIRFTNFVEIMAPCFSTAFLRRCAPSFGETISGWGLDYLWPSWVSSPERIAIVDAVAVRHTRPLGGPNYQALADRGLTAADEMRQLFHRYGIQSIAQFVTGGVDIQGRHLSAANETHSALVAALLAGYLPELANQIDAILLVVQPHLDLLPTATWIPEDYRLTEA